MFKSEETIDEPTVKEIETFDSSKGGTGPEELRKAEERNADPNIITGRDAGHV